VCLTTYHSRSNLQYILCNSASERKQRDQVIHMFMAVLSVTDQSLHAGVCAVQYALLTYEGVSRCAKTCWSLAQTRGLWPRAGKQRSKKACQTGTFGRHGSLFSCIDRCAAHSFHTVDM